MVGKPAHVLNNNLNHNTYNTLEWIHHVLIPTLRYMKETMSPLTLTIRLIVKPDFDEENRIINRCSGMIVDGQIATGSHYSGNLSSASSSLASSSETISSFSNMIANDYSLPGCSKSEHCDDSNTTIKNMIHSRKPVYTVEDASRKEVYKPDFMQKLLNSGIQEKKDFPKGKLYKGDQMGESSCENHTPDVCELDAMGGPSGRTSSNASSIGSTSSDSTKEFTVPSTSNAEKLLGLDDSQKNEPGSSKSARKRRYEPSPPQYTKKFCPDGSQMSSSSDSSWLPSLPGSSMATALQVTLQSLLVAFKMLILVYRFQAWSNAEKIQAIDALIGRCAASHVRHMMKAIEPLFQRDFISLLPKELALTVLGYLQPKDLLRAAQTCRYWRFLADDNLLWKEQCRRIGITTLKKMPRSLPRCVSPWKAAYMRQYLIENNWLHKPVNNPIMMRGHDDHVITCLQFYGNRILSGSDDTTLKVWSAITGKCLRTLVGHSGGVWSSQMVGDLVISGSTDRTLRVWNAKTGHCQKVLAGHTSTVRCMHLYNNRVVSGSRDATLRVWSIPEGRCLRVLVGHLAAVRCVQYDGKVVVSGAYDYFVKVWNPDTGECLHTLAGHTNQSGQLKHTLTGHQSLTSGMELHSNILVSGNADSTVKVWDITTGHCLHTLSGPNKHQSAVTCLQSSNRFVITSSDDGTVKLWDVRTGEFIRNLVELSSGGSGGVVWRIRASATKLICAVGSRNGTEETKLLVLDFDVPGACRKCDE
ncbi:hypothetical protein MSG28_000785 [Choristoneura fumiferana]|uniref:Uncharacterized protein n=1 Tax=Choristoneura fumiferana TaxID=7141 RepID=A0ACC0K2V0_CHOFU|nr:hypothetical protein MSG28_000785 [Choristoneura fumiferana]